MNTKAVIFGLLITSFIIGNIYRFSFFSPQVRISFLDISVIILTIVSLVRNKGRIIIKSVAVFAVVSLFSLLLSTRYGLPAQMIGSFYWLRWVMFPSPPSWAAAVASRATATSSSERVGSNCVGVSWLQYI